MTTLPRLAKPKPPWRRDSVRPWLKHPRKHPRKSPLSESLRRRPSLPWVKHPSPLPSQRPSLQTRHPLPCFVAVLRKRCDCRSRAKSSPISWPKALSLLLRSLKCTHGLKSAGRPVGRYDSSQSWGYSWSPNTRSGTGLTSTSSSSIDWRSHASRTQSDIVRSGTRRRAF